MPSDVITNVTGIWSVFLKVLFVYKEFCDYESGALELVTSSCFQLLLLKHLTFHKVV